MSGEGTTTVERVRLRGAPVEESVARLRVSHLLSLVALQPPGMPPSAILMVRSMPDPLPGRFTKRLAPGSVASRDWETAAQLGLSGFYGRAARPFRGAAPSSAAAVLFADHGELLACLARDLASGTALGWWWESTLRRFPSRLPGSWVAAWVEEPQYVPAALEYLERQHQAVKVLERIAPIQAWNLLMAVLRAFDLPGLIMTPSAVGGQGKASLPKATSQDLTGSSEPVRAIATLPWGPHVSQSSTPAQLGYERQSLLGMGLLLHRFPRVASTSGFALRFREWVREMELGNSGSDSWRSLPNPGPAGTVERMIWASGLLEHPEWPNRRKGDVEPAARDSLPDLIVPGTLQRGGHLVGDDSPSGSPDSVIKTDTAYRGRSDSLSPEVLPRHPVQDRKPLTRGKAPDIPHPLMTVDCVAVAGDSNLPPGARRDSVPGEAVPPATAQPALRQISEADALEYAAPSILMREWEGGEPTRAGGVLYLIHFLQRSELLRHFDTGLGGWELLELLARCLLDDAPSVADDAIWAALAHLDGRDSGAPPGSAFQVQRTYRVPESWLEGLAHQPQCVRFRARGFEIWSAEGFLLLDSTEGVLPSNELLHLTRSTRRTFRRPARVGPIGLSLSPALRRFLHFVLPYARWRLDRALGGVRVEEALMHTGRLYLTATHVDLVMPISEVSVPVRLAGLDANPGWVPELGRVVTFHFIQEGH